MIGDDRKSLVRIRPEKIVIVMQWSALRFKHKRKSGLFISRTCPARSTRIFILPTRLLSQPVELVDNIQIKRGNGNTYASNMSEIAR